MEGIRGSGLGEGMRGSESSCYDAGAWVTRSNKSVPRFTAPDLAGVA